MKHYLTLIIFTIVITSCGTTNLGTRAVYDGVGGATGAVIANELSGGDPILTGVGSLVGVGVAELAQSASKDNANRKAVSYAEKKVGDNTKELFWASQRRDALFNQLAPKRTRKILYQVQVDETEEGVDKDPQTILIPIEEPR